MKYGWYNRTNGPWLNGPFDLFSSSTLNSNKHHHKNVLYIYIHISLNFLLACTIYFNVCWLITVDPEQLSRVLRRGEVSVKKDQVTFLIWSELLTRAHPHWNHSQSNIYIIVWQHCRRKWFVSVYRGKHSNTFTQSHCNESDTLSKVSELKTIFRRFN